MRYKLNVSKFLCIPYPGAQNYGSYIKGIEMYLYIEKDNVYQMNVILCCRVFYSSLIKHFFRFLTQLFDKAINREKSSWKRCINWMKKILEGIWSNYLATLSKFALLKISCKRCRWFSFIYVEWISCIVGF